MIHRRVTDQGFTVLNTGHAYGSIIGTMNIIKMVQSEEQAGVRLKLQVTTTRRQCWESPVLTQWRPI
jgi:hypothetical protein